MSDHCCGGSKPKFGKTGDGGYLEVSASEVNKLGNAVRIVDVRQPDEYVGELGHIDGAELHTLGPDLEAQLEKFPKDKEIIFVCRSGARSGRAAQAAQSLGFAKAYNMVGGMLAWNAEGFEVKR